MSAGKTIRLLKSGKNDHVPTNQNTCSAVQCRQYRQYRIQNASCSHRRDSS